MHTIYGVPTPPAGRPGMLAPMPDRYADVVRARRAELREMRVLLSVGYRAELRSCLALSRLAAAADAAAALAELRREAAEHAAGGDRAARQRLPGLLASAIEEIARTVHAGWAAGLRPAVRRIATERGLAVEPGFPRLPAPRLPGPPPPLPEPANASPGPLLAGAVQGTAVWRLVVFPLAVLPVLGLPVLGLPALTWPGAAPLAATTGVVAVVLGVRHRRTSLERTRARRHAEHVISAAAAAIEADLDRRIVAVERSAVAVLDAAVLRRRAAVEAELARLVPEARSTRDG